MPQFFPYEVAGRIPVFNGQITGDFSNIVIGTNVISLGIDKAINSYVITAFNITVTNEFALAAPSGNSFEIMLQSSTNGTTWSDIVSISVTDGANFTGIISATVPTDSTVDIAENELVRIIPVNFFTTNQQSFHILVEGNAI